MHQGLCGFLLLAPMPCEPTLAVHAVLSASRTVNQISLCVGTCLLSNAHPAAATELSNGITMQCRFLSIGVSLTIDRARSTMIPTDAHMYCLYCLHCLYCLVLHVLAALRVLHVLPVLPAGVDDWGLGQLCMLTCLTNLNLAATGIHLEAPTVLHSLSHLSNLAVLRLDR